MKVLAKAQYTMDLEAFGEGWTPEELMTVFKLAHGPFPPEAIIEVKSDRAHDFISNKLTMSFVAKISEDTNV